jgi:hypothetical protein
MKILRQLILMIIFLAQFCLLQGQDSLKTRNANVASFVAKIDIKQATKDGIYLNGYVVNIPYARLTELNGKIVRISGKVTIVRGNKHYADSIIRQGREEDTRHILKPKIQLKDD